MKPLFFKKLLLGAIVALLTWCATLIVFSFISMRLEDPKKLLGVFATISLIAGSFIGGKLAFGSVESKPISAIFAALAVLLPYTVLSLIVSGAGGFSLIKALIVFISAFAGAFLTKGERKNTSSRRLRKNIASKYASYSKG